MKGEILRKLLKKLPPGVSISLPGFSVDPKAFAEYLSKKGSQADLVDLRDQLAEMTRNATEGFNQMAADLVAAGVKSEEQYRLLIAALRTALAPPQQLELPSCFLAAADAFSALIERNFLFEFHGQDSDYVELLSKDLRRLFFSLFNVHLRSGRTNRLVVSGYEGSGKTFNLLLLSLQLIREGYAVHYCNDIQSSSLTPEVIRSIATRDDDKTILIIDNCQHDLIKAEQLILAISKADDYKGQPLFFFLTRPLDDDTRLDTFGANTPTLTMREHFVDFERLVHLRFEQLGQPEGSTRFLERVSTTRIKDLTLKYRNMAFWNEVLRSIVAGLSESISENDILKHAHAFLQRKESYFLDSREAISRLLPLFCFGVAVQLEYAAELLGDGAQDALSILSSEGLVSIVAQDWVSQDFASTSTLVVAPRLHPTKARLVALIYQKYYMPAVDPVEALADYVERFPQCLYHILGRYSDPEQSRLLFSYVRIQAITRRFLIERHIGKKSDRVIRRLVGLDESILDVLLDEEMLQVFAKQINGDRAYLVNKMSVLRALQRVSPRKAYRLFGFMTPGAVTRTFLADETESGITSFSKWMEIFKNVYYHAPTEETKEVVRDFIRKVIDECRTEFMRRFEEKHIFFTQLHWLIKRLHGLKLADYFLEGVNPEKLLELIRMKDTNVVELCRGVLDDAQCTPWIEQDGSRRCYADVLRKALCYEDLKRIFDNERSDLYDLAINATRVFIAEALIRYADDPLFSQKAAQESAYKRDMSIRLISTNWILNETQKAKLIETIKKAGEAYVSR
ncbi:MAG: hypothetical protein JW724_03335 [Candidatus Altiarchaeota archaeon]|nr:hypothetical protein [Candidatus Altiarchaeota archaeon]